MTLASTRHYFARLHAPPPTLRVQRHSPLFSHTLPRRHNSTHSSSSVSKACPECAQPQPLPALVCTNNECGALQIIPPSLSAFDLMGLDVAQVEAHGWSVDQAELKNAWIRRIGAAHPDRARARGEKQVQIAEAQSAALNRAYETLRRPLQRAHLLLELHGYTAPAEDEGVDDPSLLMQVMESREALEEATTEEEVEAVRRENDEYMQATLSELERAFNASPPDLDAARLAAVKLRYWTGIDKACQEWSG